MHVSIVFTILLYVLSVDQNPKGHKGQASIITNYCFTCYTLLKYNSFTCKIVSYDFSIVDNLSLSNANCSSFSFFSASLSIVTSTNFCLVSSITQCHYSNCSELQLLVYIPSSNCSFLIIPSSTSILFSNCICMVLYCLVMSAQRTSNSIAVIKLKASMY